MKIKMLFVLLLLSFGILFTACEQDSDFEIESPTKIETRKAINTVPIDDADDCTTVAFPTCDCEYLVSSITRPSDNWRLYTFAQHIQCCVFGNEIPYLDETNIPLNVWQPFDCSLRKNAQINFGFTSSDFASCEYPRNDISVKVRCGSNEVSLKLSANGSDDCTPATGSRAINLSSECYILF